MRSLVLYGCAIAASVAGCSSRDPQPGPATRAVVQLSTEADEWRPAAHVCWFAGGFGGRDQSEGSAAVWESGLNGTVDLGGGETATISNSDGVSFDWSSTIPIRMIIVPGTPRVASAYGYNPPATSGTGLIAPKDSDNGDAQTTLAHIIFCFIREAGSTSGGTSSSGGSTSGGKAW
jgi:hypothetical protein